MDFCCKEKCFKEPRTQVDGQACSVCESFSYCRCMCKTFTKYVYLHKGKIRFYPPGFRMEVPENHTRENLKFLKEFLYLNDKP